MALLAMAGAGLVLSSAAGAADKPVAAKSDAEVAQALQDVGHCVAASRPDLSAQYVTMDYKSDEYRKLGDKLGKAAARCKTYSHGLRSSGVVFAASIAEGLLIKDALLGDLAAHTAYREDLPSIEVQSPADLMAYCIVRKAPGETAALLATDLVSDEELAAFKTLAPVLPTCVPADAKAEFTREGLRSLIALAAYRLYAHNQTGGEG
ncbi:hypothetical protein [Sphingomicrobium nitratireducens]|uniref:hypothetical protein n=1 Tax=Sphingomicrobium nitratireducens TaxID=2964666 RepID=UPI00223EA7F0|nr:hypothetical protein [Sphingomicrobium nitratireducens]